MNNRAITSLAAGIALAGSSAGAGATVFDIFQLSAYMGADEIGFPTALDDRILDASLGPPFREFEDVFGLTVSFTNNLTDGLGTVRWRIDNTSGGDFNNVEFFAFLDGEVTEVNNSFFNEEGELDGLGANPEDPDSFEIDERAPSFGGDILANLDNGVLDGNDIPGVEADVAMALGFDIGTFLAGETLIADFTISRQDIDGLKHIDEDAGIEVWFNGTARVTTVPEPTTLMIMGLGFAALGTARRLARRA